MSTGLSRVRVRLLWPPARRFPRKGDLGTEMVDQLVTLRYAQANMKVLRVQSDLMGSLVNLWG